LGGIIALAGKIIALNGGNTVGNLLIIIGFVLNALVLFVGISKIDKQTKKV
jgi:hypothetical protein